MSKRAALISLFLGMLATGYSQVDLTATNYADPLGPRFSGAYAEPAGASPAALSVASYNIQYARNVPQATADLRAMGPPPDILLLQEMDEAGTEQIARALALNYVYYPAAIHPQSDSNFGNAILSRWPIASSEKIILPHQSLGTGMIRIAVRAALQIGTRTVAVYSVHTETVLIPARERREQVAALLHDADAAADLVIVGGDFNTVTGWNGRDVAARFADEGFDHASAGSGYTMTRFRLPATTDHIFSRGFAVTGSGKLDTATGSDHLPVWVTLRPVY